VCVLRFTPTDREAPMPATFVEEVSIAHLFKDVISATQTTFFYGTICGLPKKSTPLSHNHHPTKRDVGSVLLSGA